MPKIYSKGEREDIVRRLKKEANSCMMQYGVKKTTVDELVHRVKIPKGTFYLFYPSKEILLFEVIMEYHEKIEGEMLREVARLGGDYNVEKLTNIVDKALENLDRSCLRQIMIHGELELLLAKLPEDMIKEHLQEDSKHVSDLFSMLGCKNGISPEAISGGFRAIFMAYRYKKEIGEENFKESILLLVKGILLQIV